MGGPDNTLIAMSIVVALLGLAVLLLVAYSVFGWLGPVFTIVFIAGFFGLVQVVKIWLDHLDAGARK